MAKLSSYALAAVCVLPCLGAGAAELNVQVTNSTGAPLPNAVVSLTPGPATPATSPGPLAPAAVVDQNFETFMPLVTVLPVGGSIAFHNGDRTMHQVYSFSPVKQFEFEVDVAKTSPSVIFDKPGVVAVGCNIHDQMITYVVVTDNPLTKISDAKGSVHFGDLAPGYYEAKAWQPDLAPGSAPPKSSIQIGAQNSELKFTLKTVPRRMTHSGHMGSY